MSSEHHGAGRFAPSPTGELHLGNLRTALLAWLFARSSGRDFLLRFEDLDADRTVPGAAHQQRADLEALGITFDGEELYQSERAQVYDHAIHHLHAQGLLYECFCTRREIRAHIQDSVRAPHVPQDAYPGTCRNLSQAQRDSRRRHRPGAIRVKAATENQEPYTVRDQMLGTISTALDDFVIRRNDGAAAYNLAVVVDDHLSGVDQVVRGDDLASSTPRQAFLRNVLYAGNNENESVEVDYAHVPLVLNSDGQRLAKRDGAVTLSALRGHGYSAGQIRDALLRSLDLRAGDLQDAVAGFDAKKIPVEPWVYSGLDATA